MFMLTDAGRHVRQIDQVAWGFMEQARKREGGLTIVSSNFPTAQFTFCVGRIQSDSQESQNHITN